MKRQAGPKKRPPASRGKRISTLSRLAGKIGGRVYPRLQLVPVPVRTDE